MKFEGLLHSQMVTQMKKKGQFGYHCVDLLIWYSFGTLSNSTVNFKFHKWINKPEPTKLYKFYQKSVENSYGHRTENMFQIYVIICKICREDRAIKMEILSGQLRSYYKKKSYLFH